MPKRRSWSRPRPWLGLAVAPTWGNSAVDLLYLPAVIAAAVLAGLRPALFAALASALAYNFFFTAPHFTFRIDNPNDVVTVIVLFAVAVVTSQLAASVRRQARIAEAHAARNATIAGLARRLLTCTTEQEIAEVGSARTGRGVRLQRRADRRHARARSLASAPSPMRIAPSDLAAAALVLDSGERAGRGVDRAVPTEWQFHPVRSGSAVIAAMGLARDDGAPPVRADQLPLLDNLLDQVALALERGRLEGEAREFARIRERDRLRSALLSIDRAGSPAAVSRRSPSAWTSCGAADGRQDACSDIARRSDQARSLYRNLLDLGPETDQPPLDDRRHPDRPLPALGFTGRRGVHLTPKEYAVLAELAKHPGRVLTHAHLLRTAWGPAHEEQIDYLRVAVRALRQKLERNPSRREFIINEPAIGYRLNA